MYDVSGNVKEWTLTEFEAIETFWTHKLARMVRGGHYFDDFSSVRLTSRHEQSSASRSGVVGFRVCCKSVSTGQIRSEREEAQRLKEKQNSRPPTASNAGERWTDTKGVPMIYVPAGKFMMGIKSNLIGKLFRNNQNDGNGPQHEQIIRKPFWYSAKVRVILGHLLVGLYQSS